MNPQEEFARAAALMQRGQTDEAESVCRALLASVPAHGGAHYLLAVIAVQRGQHAAAAEAFVAALKVNPNVPQVLRDYGITLGNLGRFPEALECFERALALVPDNAVIHNYRGAALRELKRPVDALAAYARALALQPELASAYYNRGVALQDLGRAADAADAYGRAVALAPNLTDAHSNRGNALKELERYEDALASYERAIASQPGYAIAHYNRGVLLMEMKRPAEALAAYERAVALNPDFASALFSRGICKLAMGRLPEGWDDFERRWEMADYPPRPSVCDAPQWMGEDLLGRSIVVHYEQGLGDVVHFARYVPELARMGATVSFVVPEKLMRLLSGLPPSVRLLSSAPPGEKFDFQSVVMSLPQRLKAGLADIPIVIPYLSADAERIARWRETIGPDGFKIGIAWQGAPWHGGAAVLGRSIPLAAFEPLARLPGVRLISLQKNQGVEQLATLPAGMNVETLGEDFDSGPDAFADTVAAMESLDLVVSCDTSIAHVAGARGRPAWIGLKYVPEWRWGLEGETTPWYPSLRLFRQRARGDWGGVFDEMARALWTRIGA